MIRESINSDQEEKEEYVLNGNCIINLNNLIKNIDNLFGLRRMRTGEGTTYKNRGGKRRGKLH